MKVKIKLLVLLLCLFFPACTQEKVVEHKQADLEPLDYFLSHYKTPQFPNHKIELERLQGSLAVYIDPIESPQDLELIIYMYEDFQKMWWQAHIHEGFVMQDLNPYMQASLLAFERLSQLKTTESAQVLVNCLADDDTFKWTVGRKLMICDKIVRCGEPALPLLLELEQDMLSKRAWPSAVRRMITLIKEGQDTYY